MPIKINDINYLKYITQGQFGTVMQQRLGSRAARRVIIGATSRRLL
jgi:hypothetical protein